MKERRRKKKKNWGKEAAKLNVLFLAFFLLSPPFLPKETSASEAAVESSGGLRT